VEYFFSIFLGTFVLEDGALALALGLVTTNRMSLAPAFFACFLGISLGDLGLYFLGYFAGQIGLEKRFKSIKKIRASLVHEKTSDILTSTVIISRFVPGTRLPTYLMAGLLRFPFLRFTLLTLVTVFAWVALAFAVGQSLKPVLLNHWILTVLLILLVLKVIKFIIPKLSDPWERKAFLHSWRIFLSFEFWPSSFFYLPIIPYYIFLSIKYRSFLCPFYASPELENGGLIGESKWDFLKYLSPESSHTLKAIKIEKQENFAAARELLAREGFSYPFILKPDVGQRGFGVRIIKNDFDLTEYILLADFNMIVQELSRYSGEAGLFYVRLPTLKDGFIFSITDKRFPFVVGDAQTKLGDLIIQDKRARIIATTYFARHRNNLNKVYGAGEIISLSECGNHCQGAIFLNGQHLITTALKEAVEVIAQRIPHFYFGRFDVRYQDLESLKNGKCFEIVEVNGAGSEATHIWDANTRLADAYRTLFRQWDLLFEIGSTIQRSDNIPARVDLGKFLTETFKVYFRKDSLSVSS
jgi:membrane protein DedA with SNARE-associated domain